ncbi:MAG TPA: trimethylamine methyltransferase family protein [Steroidobacteraceae bacterium]|nr:trimethylamine methyltransferase family protein [Steroidobacteraceae bacterium]
MSEGALIERTGRGRGRDARRAARAHRTPAKLPYIRRRLPVIDLLSSEAVEIIERNAETILEEIGIEFRRDPESLRLWRAAGADVHGERVRIPRGLARALLATAPREFTLHARNPARNVRFGGDATVFSPVGGPPFVTDLDRGRRYGTLEDLHNFIKLAHVAPAIHFSGGTAVEPMDIPPGKRHLDVQYAYFRLSDQGCEATPETPGHAADAVRMAEVLFGEEFLGEHVVVLGNINSNSPLTFDGRMLGALRVFAAKNQGTIVVPAVLAGAMGPVTAAGCMAEILAETLAGMALTQLVRPGAPVIMGSFVGAVSMRTGAPTFGTPEATQMIFATTQLARRLGVPCRSGGSLCSSKVSDAQAAYESAHTLLPTLLAGVNLVTHAAGWLEGGLVSGYEKFVMDVDQLAMMQVLAAGMDLSERGQALDAIREVGPGNHFLGCAHTQANFESAFYQSTIADYSSYEQWSLEGSLNAEQRANKVWKQMLADYEDPGLDPARDEALQAYMAQRKAVLADAVEEE